jgi:hypothetical protein
MQARLWPLLLMQRETVGWGSLTVSLLTGEKERSRTEERVLADGERRE